MKPLIVEEAAELELIGSVAFYEERKTGLGLDFAAAARQARITTNFETLLQKETKGTKVVPLKSPLRFLRDLLLKIFVSNSCPFVVTISLLYDHAAVLAHYRSH